MYPLTWRIKTNWLQDECSLSQNQHVASMSCIRLYSYSTYFLHVTQWCINLDSNNYICFKW